MVKRKIIIIFISILSTIFAFHCIMYICTSIIMRSYYTNYEIIKRDTDNDIYIYNENMYYFDTTLNAFSVKNYTNFEVLGYKKVKFFEILPFVNTEFRKSEVFGDDLIFKSGWSWIFKERTFLRKYIYVRDGFDVEKLEVNITIDITKYVNYGKKEIKFCIAYGELFSNPRMTFDKNQCIGNIYLNINELLFYESYIYYDGEKIAFEFCKMGEASPLLFYVLPEECSLAIDEIINNP